MCQRLLVFALTITLITIPLGPVVAPEGTVAHADYEYCEHAVVAYAYLYSDGSEVGGAGGQGAFLDAQTSDHCASVAQQYALFDAGNACGAYPAGVAYAVVEWRVWWAYQEVPGSPVVQQYDCGDV
jgi:hypothetical protein